MDGRRERGADRRPVFREQAAGFVADAAGVAEGFGAHRAGPPLGGFLDIAVGAAAGRRRRRLAVVFRFLAGGGGGDGGGG